MKLIRAITANIVVQVLSASAVTCVLIVCLAGCESGDQTTPIDTTPAIVVAPKTSSMSASSIGVMTFTATGGSSNYTWRVRSTSLGRIYSAGSSATYQSTTNVGVNIIYVSDELGHSDSATVAQQ